jgi:PadR family transcriptional regulator AphA
MTSRAPALSATEYTLLGLIAQAEPAGPVHGYDLQRHLSEESLARVIRIEPGMMYHYLKKLAARGFITAEVASQQGRPARHLHTLTPEGRESLEAWVTTPVRSTREMRLEFLIKLWFARQQPDRATKLRDAQETVIRDTIASLQAQIDALPADDTFGREVLDLRLRQNTAIRDWMTALEAPR